MSTPIIFCNVVKAAKGDEVAYRALLAAYRYNLQCGHYSHFPCQCSPKCEAPEEELKALEIRLNGDLAKPSSPPFAKPNSEFSLTP